MTTHDATVKLIKHGEVSFTVSAAEFRAAREAGELDALLELRAHGLEPATAVVGPDGLLTELFTLRPATRPTLLGGDVTAALAALIAGIRPRPHCGGCLDGGPTACAQHIAQELVSACRLEDLIIMPAADADAAMERFVSRRSDRPDNGDTARVLVTHATDPLRFVEVTDADGSGFYDASCQHPSCPFATGKSEGRHMGLEDIVQEAIVHVACHPH